MFEKMLMLEQRNLVFGLIAPRQLLCALTMGIALFAYSGCSSPPEVVPVSGVVTLNGNPLPHASIKFIPIQEGLDGNFVGKAVTDNAGKFVLTNAGAQKNGACACECKVIVNEGPLPDELVELGQAGFRKVAAFHRSLKNRPIPEKYMTIGKTPLSFTVTPEQTEYTIELTR